MFQKTNIKLGPSAHLGRVLLTDDTLKGLHGGTAFTHLSWMVEMLLRTTIVTTCMTVTGVYYQTHAESAMVLQLLGSYVTL